MQRNEGEKNRQKDLFQKAGSKQARKEVRKEKPSKFVSKQARMK